MTDKGKAAKRTRYIKQELDRKGRIKKSSRVVKWIVTTEWVHKTDMLVKNLRLNLAIRSVIIVILILLLIMWR